MSALESESNIAIDCFKANKMFVNPGKSHSIIIDKNKQDHRKEISEIGDKVIEASPSVKLLGLQLDDQLNFNLHITNICRTAANHLNALTTLKRFSSFEAKKVLVNKYFHSNFSYYPLVCIFSSAKSLNKSRISAKKSPSFSDYESP